MPRTVRMYPGQTRDDLPSTPDDNRPTCIVRVAKLLNQTGKDQ
jgi:hypothetical protein